MGREIAAHSPFYIALEVEYGWSSASCTGPDQVEQDKAIGPSCNTRCRKISRPLFARQVSRISEEEKAVR